MNTRYILLLGLLSFVAYVHADSEENEDDPSQSSFSPCAPGGRICTGTGTECIRGQCLCKRNFDGIPLLACHREKYRICSMLSDPRAQTFAREPHKGVDVPLPCQFQATHVSMTGSRGATDGIRCDIRVFVSEQRIKGNFFVNGFQVQIGYINEKKGPNGVSGEFYFRGRGAGNNGQYSYTLETRAGSSGDWVSDGQGNPLQPLNVDLGGPNKFRVRQQENRVELLVDKCGLQIFFRPADASLTVRDQTQMPGITIGVDESNFDVAYESLEDTFCLTSNIEARDVADVTEHLRLNNDEAFLYTALKSMTPQDFPGIYDQGCIAAHTSVQQCTDEEQRTTAMEACSFIMQNKAFVNCYTKDLGDFPDSRNLLALFSDCINSFCTGNLSSCLNAQSEISARNCNEYAGTILMGISCQFLAQSFAS